MQQIFTHISDLHLTSLAAVRWSELCNKRLLGYLSWRKKRRFEHRMEVLDVLRSALKAENMDQLLVTGDLTHIGLPAEFKQVLAWLEQVGEPEQIAVVPGNHDAYVKENWSSTFDLWRNYLASDNQTQGTAPGFDNDIFPTLRIRGQIAFIGLSSACPTPPFFATGTLGLNQLERLKVLLADCASKGLFRVIYLHHPPLSEGEKWRKRLTDACALGRVVASEGVELILHGHSHRANSTELHTCHGLAPVIAVSSASALGQFGADVAAYNSFILNRVHSGWTLDMLPYLYSPELRQFTAGSRREISIIREY